MQNRYLYFRAYREGALKYKYLIAQNQSFAQKGVGAKYIGIPFNALQPLYLQPTLL